MHNIVRFIAPVFIMFFLCGCTPGGVSVELEVEEYETDDELVYVEKPVISGLSDKEFQQAVNISLSDTVASVKEKFLQEAQNTREQRTQKAKLDIKQEIAYNKNPVLSLIGECFEFTEGFNGKSTRTVKNINTETNCELKLSDIFCDEQYKDMLNSILEEKFHQAEYSDLWEKPVITEAQNDYFYFSDDGIVVFYPPYELSYYARGFVEFTIEYDKLYGYLKPEYTF